MRRSRRFPARERVSLTAAGRALTGRLEQSRVRSRWVRDAWFASHVEADTYARDRYLKYGFEHRMRPSRGGWTVYRRVPVRRLP